MISSLNFVDSILQGYVCLCEDRVSILKSLLLFVYPVGAFEVTERRKWSPSAWNEITIANPLVIANVMKPCCGTI